MSLFRRRGGTIPALHPGDDEFAVRLSNGGCWPDARLWGLPPGDLLRIWETDPDGYWRRSQEEARALAERISAERDARRRAAFWSRVRRTLTPWRNHERCNKPGAGGAAVREAHHDRGPDGGRMMPDSGDERLAKVRLIDGPFDNTDVKMGLPLPNVLGYSRGDALHVYGRDIAISWPGEPTVYSFRYVGAQNADGEVESVQADPPVDQQQPVMQPMSCTVQIGQDLWIVVDDGDFVTCRVIGMQGAASGPDDGLVSGLTLRTIEQGGERP